MIDSIMNWLKPRDRMFDENENGHAGEVAKKRLQVLLIHDRNQLKLPPEKMAALRNDLLEVLSRYVEVDTNQLEINLEQLPDSRQMAITSNIPVKRIINSEC